MPSFRNISKNFSILFLGNVLSQGLYFYGIIVIAYAVSPEIFGRFSFAQAFTLFFIRLSELGLETYSIRRIVLKESERIVVSECFNARLLFSVITYVASHIILYLLPIASETKTITSICLLSIFGNMFLLEWYFQAKEQMEYVGLSRVIRAVSFTVPLLLLAPSGIRESTISLFYVVSFFIPAMVLFGLSYNKIGSKLYVCKINTTISTLLQSSPLGLSSTLMQIPFNSGTIIIGILLTADAVAIYSAGYRVSLVIWSFGIVALYNAIFPAMTSLVNEKQKYDQFVEKLSIILYFGSGVVILCSIAFTQTIIDLFYQGKYDASVEVLRVSLFTVSLILARTAIEYSLLAQNKLVTYLQGMILVSILYVITGVVGVIINGVMGMIYAAAISEIVYTVYVFSKYENNVLRKNIIFGWIKIIVISVSAIILYAVTVKNNEWIAVTSMFMVFLILLALFFHSTLHKFIRKI